MSRRIRTHGLSCTGQSSTPLRHIDVYKLDTSRPLLLTPEARGQSSSDELRNQQGREELLERTFRKSTASNEIRSNIFIILFFTKPLGC